MARILFMYDIYQQIHISRHLILGRLLSIISSSLQSNWTYAGTETIPFSSDSLPQEQTTAPHPTYIHHVPQTQTLLLLLLLHPSFILFPLVILPFPILQSDHTFQLPIDQTIRLAIKPIPRSQTQFGPSAVRLRTNTKTLAE